MKNLIAILTIALLAACGNDDGNNNTAAIAPARASKKTEQEKKPAVSTTYAYAVAEDLPTCNEKTQNWLVYIKASGEFQTCDAGVWSVVDIQGPQGETGEAGPQGVQGVAGPAGQDGEDAELRELGDTFVDPDTLASITVVDDALNYTDAVAACTALGGTLPPANFSWKFFHYFAIYFSTISNSTAFWTSTASASGHLARTISSDGQTTVDTNNTALRFAICLH